MQGEWYIYGLVDPRTGGVRYVGKSADPRRRLAEHLRDKSSRRLPRWIAVLRSHDLEPEIVVLESGTGDWQEAECRWIAALSASGVELLNHTTGGEGLCGAIAETRAKLKAIREAEWADPERRAVLMAILKSDVRRARISASLRGQKKAPEHVAKLPQNRPGWRHTPEARSKIAANSRGHRWNSSDIESLRIANIGNAHGIGNRSRTGQVQSAEERAKKSAALKGRPKTREHREKIRAAALRRWAREREANNAAGV